MLVCFGHRLTIPVQDRDRAHGVISVLLAQVSKGGDPCPLARASASRMKGLLCPSFALLLPLLGDCGSSSPGVLTSPPDFARSARSVTLQFLMTCRNRTEADVVTAPAGPLGLPTGGRRCTSATLLAAVSGASPDVLGVVPLPAAHVGPPLDGLAIQIVGAVDDHRPASHAGAGTVWCRVPDAAVHQTTVAHWRQSNTY